MWGTDDASQGFGHSIKGVEGRVTSSPRGSPDAQSTARVRQTAVVTHLIPLPKHDPAGILSSQPTTVPPLQSKGQELNRPQKQPLNIQILC